jgi:Na+/melibiose symporter-like transporter
MVSNVSLVLNFIVALIISTVIIYYVAKFFGAKDSLTTAVIAALAGSAVYPSSITCSVTGCCPQSSRALSGSLCSRNSTP